MSGIPKELNSIFKCIKSFQMLEFDDDLESKKEINTGLYVEAGDQFQYRGVRNDKVLVLRHTISSITVLVTFKDGFFDQHFKEVEKHENCICGGSPILEFQNSPEKENRGFYVRCSECTDYSGIVRSQTPTKAWSIWDSWMTAEKYVPARTITPSTNYTIQSDEIVVNSIDDIYTKKEN